MLTITDLIAFEQDIAECFNRGEIRAPIHLSGNNEQQLITYFEQNYDAVRGDWIFSNWRSHFHCLLAGVNPQRLKTDILAGRSITLTYPDHRILSSAIVGGALPIALGVALSIKRQGGIGWSKGYVHVFVGDMTARTGIFWECLNYAEGHSLPIHFIIEDNGKSVVTPTSEVWDRRLTENSDGEGNNNPFENRSYVSYYRYILPWPHAGAGHRVQF